MVISQDSISFRKDGGADMKQITLNGNDWEFKSYLDGEWVKKQAYHPECSDTRGWLKANVPGSVHHDLWVNGMIPDPYFEQNSLLSEWVPVRSWVYRKTFFIDEEDLSRQIHLHFKGVDYEAEVYLNGERLGSICGMFVPASFNISDKVHSDRENVLAVVLFPAPPSESQLGRTSLVRRNKARMNYWWDFCPRMVHVGIWDDVCIKITDAIRINDAFIRPQLDEDFKRANLKITLGLDSAFSTQAEIEITVMLGGAEVASARSSHHLVQGETELTDEIHIEHPELWWPNGYGEQPLYTCKVKVAFPDGKYSDHQDITFGIRKVEFTENEQAAPEALPYTLVVNGRKVYMKGWNWVPADVLYGAVEENKVEHLLALAKRAHVNLLRIWGGGLIEKDYFYEICNRSGIMVWQEFTQSSSSLDNKPADDEEYIGMMTAEAEHMIKGKRNHPSLVIWGGGNELEGLDNLPLNDAEPVLAALKAKAAELDPDRLWLPCSSSGKMPFNGINTMRNRPQDLHDVHGPWHHQGLVEQYTQGNLGACLLHSEFGAEGLTNLKTLHSLLSSEHLWPVTLDDPVWYHLGAWWVKEEKWKDMLGDIPNLETLVDATQYLQAEAVRYTIERNRSRKYQNSGSIPWQMNEPYPMAACTSAIDYYGRPKFQYYAVAEAYAPVLVTAKFPKQIWENEEQFTAELGAVNSSQAHFEEAKLIWSIYGQSGKQYVRMEEQVTVRPDASASYSRVVHPLGEIEEELFFLDLLLVNSQGERLSSNRYLFTKCGSLSPMIHMPETHLDVAVKEDGHRWLLTVTNTGESAAMFVRLDDERDVKVKGHAYFSVNHFSLLPQESRTVAVDWESVDRNERAIEIKAMNTIKKRV
jgi:beta-mannosidase